MRFRAFPERVGPRILSLESVDYFGTSELQCQKKKRILKELCHEIQPNQEITKCPLNQEKHKNNRLKLYSQTRSSVPVANELMNSFKEK